MSEKEVCKQTNILHRLYSVLFTKRRNRSLHPINVKILFNILRNSIKAVVESVKMRLSRSTHCSFCNLYCILTDSTCTYKRKVLEICLTRKCRHHVQQDCLPLRSHVSRRTLLDSQVLLQEQSTHRIQASCREEP